MVKPAQIDLSSLTFEDQKVLCQGLKEWQEVFTKDTIYHFKPNPGQARFFHPELPDYPRFRVAHAGNRGGKSEAGILEDWAFAHGYRPWDNTQTPMHVPNRGRIATESYDVIKKNIEPKIKALWPKESIASMKRGQTGNLSEIHFTNGSSVDIVSYEQEPDKHESVDLDWVHFDEPPPRAHYIANIRGLIDRGGYWWITATPIKEPWVVDEIVERCGKDPNYYLVEWSTYTNVGYGLTEKKVQDFEATLTPDEVTARIHGKPLILQGAVYPEFKDHMFKPGAATLDDAGGHVIKPFEIQKDWNRYCGCDPHDRSPTHLLWIAVTPKQDVVVYDELQLPPMSVEDMSDAIKVRETEHKEPTSRPIMRIIDPSAARRSNVLEVGANMKDQFMENNLYFYSAVNELDAGHKKVREYLKFVDTPNSGWKPRLYIFDTCNGFRHAMKRYIWDDFSSPKEAQKRDPKQKPREKFKHFPDIIRYLLMANPHYYAPSNSKHKGYEPANRRTGY